MQEKPHHWKPIRILSLVVFGLGVLPQLLIQRWRYVHHWFLDGSNLGRVVTGDFRTPSWGAPWSVYVVLICLAGLFVSVVLSLSGRRAKQWHLWTLVVATILMGFPFAGYFDMLSAAMILVAIINQAVSPQRDGDERDMTGLDAILIGIGTLLFIDLFTNMVIIGGS